MEKVRYKPKINLLRSKPNFLGMLFLKIITIKIKKEEGEETELFFFF